MKESLQEELKQSVPSNEY